ncbi:group-specific protein [Virgibacillus doumboii]|uniref:group-specific protein n=1 Tax=Virgibacillus doumboii TaxID=2697503 RepID=UPI0013DFDFBE|nr:group-specific protein [Virgibacillus doumboii]
MGKCNIDHSHADVVKKLESQESFLPDYLTQKIQSFLKEQHSQETLNDLFHLLKKYDLSSDNEREERNEKMLALTS